MFAIPVNQETIGRQVTMGYKYSETYIIPAKYCYSEKVNGVWKHTVISNEDRIYKTELIRWKK